jgi:hypothetical protein
LNCEKFTTTLYQKKVRLFSRLLQTIPTNPSDLLTLTSTNFRVELSLSATPKLNIMLISNNMLNGKGRKKKVENFWKRRGNEYLEHKQNLNDDPGKSVFMSTK